MIWDIFQQPRWWACQKCQRYCHLSNKWCLPSEGVFRWRSYLIKGHLPLTVTFNQICPLSNVEFHHRWSFLKGYLLLKGVIYCRLSSIKGCLPLKEFFHWDFFQIITGLSLWCRPYSFSCFFCQDFNLIILSVIADGNYFVNILEMLEMCNSRLIVCSYCIYISYYSSPANGLLVLLTSCVSYCTARSG